MVWYSKKPLYKNAGVLSFCFHNLEIFLYLKKDQRPETVIQTENGMHCRKNHVCIILPA